MGTHFFLVTSSTWVTNLWSKMATPVPVITSASQLVGQKIILIFGSDLSTLLNFHWLKYLPWSWQTWGWWVQQQQGNVILLQNIHDEYQGPPAFIHVSVIHSSLVLPKQLSVYLG